MNNIKKKPDDINKISIITSFLLCEILKIPTIDYKNRINNYKRIKLEKLNIKILTKYEYKYVECFLPAIFIDYLYDIKLIYNNNTVGYNLIVKNALIDFKTLSGMQRLFINEIVSANIKDILNVMKSISIYQNIIEN